MVQLSNTTIEHIIPKRYLQIDTVLTADKFDKSIGAYIAILYKYGVVSYPNVKPALFFDYCDRINLKLNYNPQRTMLWLDECEEGVKKIISEEFTLKKNYKYNNIQKLIDNGNKGIN